MISSMEKVHNRSAILNANLASGTIGMANGAMPTDSDLLATANDLYKSIDALGGVGDDEDYWKSFPPHIRSFVSLIDRCMEIHQC